MDRRLRSSLLWGVSGALMFLVLAQGIRLFAVLELGMGLSGLLPVAGGVFVVTAGLGWLLEGRIEENRQL